jgi:GNAT superfamily N-acetyltransferase
MPISIALLADHPQLIPSVGEIRWREWGHAPEPESLDWWVEITAQEAGRDGLPVTWAAIDEQGQAVGAVGLGEFDIEERRDRSPWVIGMIVDPAQRGQGIGGRLMQALEAWAAQHGYARAWVATGGPAVDFYRKCGWELVETFQRAATGEMTSVLTKALLRLLRPASCWALPELAPYGRNEL